MPAETPQDFDRNFDAVRIGLAFNAKLSIDELNPLEGQIWEAMFFEHCRTLGYITDEEWRKEINKRWDEDGNRVDGPPLPKMPFFDSNRSLGQQMLEKAPRYEIVNILREYLKLTEFELSNNPEREEYAHETAVMANFHSGHERSDEKKALDEMFLQMRLPNGELRRYCINQYLNYVAKRDFPDQDVDLLSL